MARPGVELFSTLGFSDPSVQVCGRMTKVQCGSTVRDYFGTCLEVTPDVETVIFRRDQRISTVLCNGLLILTAVFIHGLCMLNAEALVVAVLDEKHIQHTYHRIRTLLGKTGS